MLSKNIEDTLENYFTWAASDNPANLLYPGTDPVRQLLGGGGVSCAGLTDEEALLINHALVELRSDNPKAFEVIWRIYAQNRTVRWMADRGEGERNTLNRLAGEGRSFIRGVVAGAKYAK